MAGFGWNYPPGVTGNEFEIAGPDYEQEVDGECGNGHTELVELAYGGRAWLSCQVKGCYWQRDLPNESESYYPDTREEYEDG